MVSLYDSVPAVVQLSARDDAVEDDGSPKYMPSTEDTSPIVRALKTALTCKEVTSAERGSDADTVV